MATGQKRERNPLWGSEALGLRSLGKEAGRLTGSLASQPPPPTHTHTTHTLLPYRHLLNIVPETAPQACVPPDHPVEEENTLYRSKNGILKKNVC